MLGPGAFQEIDLASAFQAVSRFSQTVLHGSRHAELASLAMKSALVERDVSHLIFPDDVQTLSAGEAARAAGPGGRLADRDVAPSAAAVAEAVEKIATAKRPIVIVGYGARQSMAEVAALAERLGAPILTTFKAKGQIADSHPLAAGVLGRSGTPIASWFMNECDLILAFGSSFSNHTGIERSKPIIQVDFEPMQLGKFHPVAVPVLGEIGVTAKAFVAAMPVNLAAEDQRAELAERWRLWREEKASRRADDRGQGLNAALVFAALEATIPDDAVISVDVGNNTYSFGRYFEPHGQAVLMSGYLGSIGFGFPAAMGAWAATQDFPELAGRKVISISGDGGFGQYMGEFTTAVKYGMDITHLLLNNSQLGKISKEQRAGEWPVWQTDLHNPNFAAFAKLCGGFGQRVTQAEELKEALERALAYNGPAIVEVIADAELV